MAIAVTVQSVILSLSFRERLLGRFSHMLFHNLPHHHVLRFHRHSPSSDNRLFDFVNRHFDIVLVYLRFDGMAHRWGEGGPEHPERAQDFEKAGRTMR